MHAKLTRRELLRLTASVGAGALLAACATAVPGEGGAVDTEGQETIELTFAMYNYDPYLKVLDQIFADYKQVEPNITTKVESAPWEDFWSRQEARLAAGTPSDLSIGDPAYFGRYAHKGYYVNIEPYVEKEQIDLARWAPVSLSDCRYDDTTGIVGQGTLFGLPINYVGSVLYYNKDLFDAAGVAYPDEGWNRDDLLEAALVLTLDSQGRNATDGNFDHEDLTQWGINMIGAYSNAVMVWNNGGELINAEQTQCLMTEPEVVEIFEWLASLLHEHYVHPTAAQIQGLPNPFQVGKVAMTMDGSWNLNPFGETLEFAWDIAPVPLGNKGRDRVTYAGTDTMHIFKDSAHIDEAWELLEYMGGTVGATYFAQTGTPGLIEIANSDIYLSGPPEHRQVAVELGSYAHNYYPGLKSDQWKQVYDAELDALWINNVPAQEVLQTICDKITPILETPIDKL